MEWGTATQGYGGASPVRRRAAQWGGRGEAGGDGALAKDIHAEGACAVERGSCDAPQGARAGATSGSEAIPAGAEDGLDEVAVAEDGAVVEVADAAEEVLIEGKAALTLEGLEEGFAGEEGGLRRMKEGLREKVMTVGVDGVWIGGWGRVGEPGDEGGEASASEGIAGESGGVAGPGVVGGVADDAGPEGVEVDVGGHGEEGAAVALNEDAAESFLPEGALSADAPVVGPAEALLEGLDEAGEVPSAGVDGGEPTGFGVGIRGEAQAVEVALEGGGVRGVGEAAEGEEGLLGGGERMGWLRDLDEEVEVVGHDGEGEDADLAELGEIEEEGTEEVFLGVGEDEAAVHDAGEAVVDG